MKILGISCHYHDAAAALLVDGRLVAGADEERFSRVKHDARFPHRAIRFCLEQGGIDGADLDAVAFYERPLLKVERTYRTLARHGRPRSGFARSTLRRSIEQNSAVRTLIADSVGIHPDRILFVPHHVSHAASAFLASGMEESAILTADAVGEWTTTMTAHGTTGADRADIATLHEIQFPHSLGMLYSAFTQFCGFQVNEGEYKLMGLAPYGEPVFEQQVRRVIDIGDDGSFRLDMRYFDFLATDRRTYSDRFVDLFGTPFSGEHLGIDRHYADIAASVQLVTEEALLAMARHAVAVTGSRRLCLAGGVALNSVAVGRISREAGLEEVFVQPAAGDGGGSLGAALYAHCVHFGARPEFVMRHASWGQAHPPADDLLRQIGLPAERIADPDRLAERAAEMLAGGAVIGLHDGRFEWGPRALGNRSILADPRPEAMKAIINAKVKYREPFRPFAPAILAERVAEYFDYDAGVEPLTSRFMTTVHPYHPGKGEEVMAVNHQGTGRLQAVGADAPHLYRRIIEAFGEATGVPLVLNTSFNLRGEPIVNTPEEALSTFYRSGLDALIVGDVLVTKRPTLAPAALPSRPAPAEALADVYAAAPELKGYLPPDSLVAHPYLVRADAPNTATERFTTDRRGYRLSRHDGEVVDSDTWAQRPRRGLLAGGSTAFGTGATSDGATVASLLAERTGISFLNLAIRGATSSTELAALQYYAAEAEVIVLLSGFNNLGAALEGSDREPFSPLFPEGVASQLARIPHLELAAILAGQRPGQVFPATLDAVEAAVGSEVAADAYRRDLTLLRKLAGAGTRIVFALQPVAGKAKPTRSNEEERVFAAMAHYRPRLPEAERAVLGAFDDYAVRLQKVCAEAGIDFLDLNEIEFDGFCFFDPAHLTDRGSALVADRIAAELC